MKSLKLGLLTSFAMIALTVLSSCGSKGENNTNQNVGTVNGYGNSYAMPMECRSMNPSMNGQRWQRHSRWGVSRYDWGREENYRDRDGRRRSRRAQQQGCGRRSFAACAPGVGIVCIPNQAYQNTQIALYSYSWGAQNATYMGPGYCGNGGMYAGRSNDTIGMVCQTSNPVSCNGFGGCLPIAQGATIGVCVQ